MEKTRYQVVKDFIAEAQLMDLPFKKVRETTQKVFLDKMSKEEAEEFLSKIISEEKHFKYLGKETKGSV